MSGKKNIADYANALNEKMKQEMKSSFTNFAANIRGFIISVIMAIITILLYFSSSGLILFVCKVAQSNVLPTNEKCAPYTNSKLEVEKIQTNIFTSSTNPNMSMKLEIPNDYKTKLINNSKYALIDFIKTRKENPKSSYLENFFIAIILPLIQFNYSVINFTMNTLNSLPEYLIVYLGPIITMFLFLICFLLNGIYFAYLWFSNLGWLFKTNLNVTGVGKPWWQSVPIFISPTKWFLSFLLMIGFIFLFLYGFRFLAVIPVGVLFYCILSSVLYCGLFNGKPATSISIIIELFRHYKTTIISLIILSIIPLAFLKLGIIPGIVLIIIMITLYCQVEDMDIFKPIPETNLTASVSNEQATRTCKQPNFVYKFLDDIGVFNISLKDIKGGGITKELKNISKNLDENNF